MAYKINQGCNLLVFCLYDLYEIPVEHNNSFDKVKGTLTDGSGKKHQIEINDKPLLVKGLAPGRVSVSLQKKPWLKQAQARTPYLEEDDQV